MEENKLCLGPVKVTAESLKRGRLRENLICPLILTPWSPERLSAFARVAQLLVAHLEQKRALLTPGIGVVPCCPCVSLCG